MYVLIVLAVLALLVLVAAYMSSKFWHWGHILVVVGLFFATLGYMYFAAKIYAHNSGYQEQVVDRDEKIERLDTLNLALQQGTNLPEVIQAMATSGAEVDTSADSVEGLIRLNQRVEDMLAARGQVWRNVFRTGPPDQQTGQVEVAVEEGTLGVNPDSLVFVFEQGMPTPDAPNEGPAYVGEFHVVSSEGGRAVLEPIVPPETLDSVRVERLSRGPNAWILYEQMPADSYDLFAGMSEEELRALLPESAVEGYLRHMTEWKDGADSPRRRTGVNEQGDFVPEEDATSFVYRRALQDYAGVFQDYLQGRAEMLADQISLQEDLAKLAEAAQDLKQVVQLRTNEQQMLNSDLAGMQRDRAAIDAHLSAINAKLQRAQSLLSQTLTASVAQADTLASRQAEIAGVENLGTTPVPARAPRDPEGL